MSKVEKAISDYLFFQEGPGIRNYQYTTEGIKLLNVSNLTNGNIDLSNSNRYISFKDGNGKYKHFLCDEGDLVIASSGIKVDYFDKKMGFIKKEMLPLCMNTSTIRFKSLDSSVLNLKYFMYYLKSNHFKNQLRHNITGSAQLNFGPSHLKKMNFIYYDIKRQKEIVKKLECINNLIEIKKKQITKFEELIKSQFVEMFGNEKKYPKEELKDNIVEMFIGPFGSALKNEFFVSEKNKSCVVYEQKHAINKYIGDFRYVDKQKHNELKRFEILPDDIIVSCRGTIGETYVIPKNAPLGIMHPSIMKIRLNNNKYNATFFNEIIKQYLSDSLSQTNGGTIKMGIKASDLKKIKFIRPELKEQLKFIDIKNKIDKQKFDFEKSMKKLEEIQSALMQEYFG